MNRHEELDKAARRLGFERTLPRPVDKKAQAVALKRAGLVRRGPSAK